MSGAAQVWQRVRLMFAQGAATLVGHKTLQATVLDDETLDGLKRIEPYGLSARARPGSQAYLVFPQGDRSVGLALVVGDERYQMELAEGEVALHDDSGNCVHLMRGGIIKARASARVIAEAPMFETTGDAIVGGNLRVAGQTTTEGNAVTLGNTMTLGRTSSAGGYSGASGAPAAMTGGASISGPLIVNGKLMDERHAHISADAGNPTSEVI